MSLPDPVLFPPLWYPLPPALNPHWEALDGPGLAWVERTALDRTRDGLDRLAGYRSGVLAARSYPNAKEVRRLQWATNLINFLFCFDDNWCDKGLASANAYTSISMANKLSYALNAPRSQVFADDPFCVALSDLRLRLDEFASPTQSRRWVKDMSDYLFKQVFHAACREHKLPPDEDQFICARIDTSGAKLLPAMNDIVEGFEVQDAELTQPATEAIVASSCLLVCLANDLFSYNEERMAEPVLNHNLVEIYAAARHCTTQDAVFLVVTEFEQVTRLYLRLQARMAVNSSSELQRYVHNCGAFFRANHDWAVSCARYEKGAINPEAASDHQWINRQHLAEHFWATTQSERSGIAAIGWWWDLLE